jgi:hypothetical protein
MRLRSVAVPLIDILENRPFPLSPLSVKETPIFFEITENTKQAALVREYFEWTTGKSSPPSSPISANTLILLRNINSLHYQLCNPDDTLNMTQFYIEMQGSWLPYLHLLAETVLPYLSPKEMEIIWKEIETAPCFSYLPDNIHDWIYLYKAVGNRNFEEILQFSNKLLPTGTIEAEKENNYLLTVAMLAHIVLKHDEAALTLWRRYRDQEQPPIELRLLGAIALQQSH